MDKYECVACGYIYDPVEHNNIDFKTLPDEFICPNCGAKKEMFHKVVIFDKEHAPFDIPKYKHK
ncbi:rubredoxin [bacterium]|nr:rubredoxin [bacterium]